MPGDAELQEKIVELNAKLAAIVESSDDAILGKDLNGVITSWNRASERMYGYTAEEVIGRHISVIVPANLFEETAAIMEKIRVGDRVDHYETVRMTKSGDLIPISLTISPVRDASGSIVGASSISRDFTRRKRYEEIIQRQASILDQIQDSVITTDLDGIITSWNRGAERLFSFTSEEALGRHVSFLYPEEQWQFLETNVIRPLKEKGEHECEVRLRRKSGEEFYALLLLTLLKDGNGVVTGMVGSSIDITARKEAEERILRDKEQWEQTFDAVPDIVMVIDSEYVIRRANRAAAVKVAVDRGDLIGNRCYRVMCRLEEPAATCPGCFAVSSGIEKIEERYIEQFEGHFLISCTPLSASVCDGCTFCFVEVWRDISDLKEMEKKLQEAASTDVLTGLYNRRGFITFAEHQIHVADREKRRLALIFLDLNDLKAINDTFGHEEGDRALADTADILRKSFRESDVKGRIGGDEFALLLLEPPETDIEQLLCEHLQQNLNIHNELSGRPYPLSVSIGVAHYDPATPCLLSDLLTAADDQMYKHKREFKKNNSRTQRLNTNDERNGYYHY